MLEHRPVSEHTWRCLEPEEYSRVMKMAYADERMAEAAIRPRIKNWVPTAYENIGLICICA